MLFSISSLVSEEHGYEIPCGVRTLKVGMAEKLGFTGYGPQFNVISVLDQPEDSELVRLVYT